MLGALAAITIFTTAPSSTPLSRISDGTRTLGEWVVATNRGDALRARFVIMSNGPLNTPKLPGVPGIESFKGHTFHTSRWDYAYTGGDARAA